MADCNICLYGDVCERFSNDLAIICKRFKNENDFVEVKHGEWEEVKYIEGCLNSYKHTCSCCGKSYFDNNSNNYPFCPLCGAKMDGERRSDNG